MTGTETILYSALGGILPALVWLYFWLREDARRPEPRGLILKTFLLGMASVILVLPLQIAVDKRYPGMVLIALLAWAIIEEAFKFIAGLLGGLASKEDNEPLDPLIYMITAALGFVALENALFISSPLFDNDILTGVMTGNLRFMGASLLHIVSSGIIGVSLSLSFYKPKTYRIFSALVAFFAAVGFHTLFNILLIHSENSGTWPGFGIVWGGVIALLFLFERIKRLRPEK